MTKRYNKKIVGIASAVAVLFLLVIVGLFTGFLKATLPLPEQTATKNLVLTIPADAAPGAYQLAVGWTGDGDEGRLVAQSDPIIINVGGNTTPSPVSSPTPSSTSGFVPVQTSSSPTVSPAASASPAATPLPSPVSSSSPSPTTITPSVAPIASPTASPTQNRPSPQPSSNPSTPPLVIQPLPSNAPLPSQVANVSPRPRPTVYSSPYVASSPRPTTIVTTASPRPTTRPNTSSRPSSYYNPYAEPVRLLPPPTRAQVQAQSRCGFWCSIARYFRGR